MVDRPINWLGDETLAMMSMVIVSVWKTGTFMALIILEGLQSIPREPHEAGREDGMSKWQESREINWPLLRGPILVGQFLVVFAMSLAYIFTLRNKG